MIMNRETIQICAIVSLPASIIALAASEMAFDPLIAFVPRLCFILIFGVGVVTAGSFGGAAIIGGFFARKRAAAHAKIVQKFNSTLPWV
jgi:hypothetical protein